LTYYPRQYQAHNATAEADFRRTEAAFLSDRVCVLSPHPGRLTAVVDVTLPRPRVREIRENPEYFSLIAKIRNSFEGV
jgi:NitT/TauT family transport system ATP-binding protein